MTPPPEPLPTQRVALVVYAAVPAVDHTDGAAIVRHVVRRALLDAAATSRDMYSFPIQPSIRFFPHNNQQDPRDIHIVGFEELQSAIRNNSIGIHVTNTMYRGHYSSEEYARDEFGRPV